MRVAVTGANGYIGSYLSRYLLLQGCEVIAISRKFSDTIMKQLAGAQFILADVLQDEFAGINLQCDMLIHTASANDIVSRDFKKGIELSLYGTRNALNLCAGKGIGQFVFFSTIQVLGSELKGEYDDDSPARIESDYAFNHYITEEYLKYFISGKNINALIIRPTNIYGAMQDPAIDRWTLVPNCFCKEGVEKGTITLLSSGNQNRCFLSLENICQGTYNSIIKFKGEKLKTLNFANTKIYPVKQLAKWTEEVFKDVFNIPVSLLIKSRQPSEGNQFEIRSSSLLEKNIIFIDNEPDFKEEVKNIIQLLLNR